MATEGVDQVEGGCNLDYYAEEVKKRLEQEREMAEEDRFLRSSLRGSDRLKAIENYRRIVRNPAKEKKAEINEAFEEEENAVQRSELAELVKYLRTKVRSMKSMGTRLRTDESPLVDESDQWEWLLNVLSDPLLSKAFLMHDRVAESYEKCRMSMHSLPRSQWAVLPGLADDALEAVQMSILEALQQPEGVSVETLENLSSLNKLLYNPKLKNLLLAMDGLAQIWLFEADTPSKDEGLDDSNQDADSSVPGQVIERSVVPGCYATLAYDENGRDAYSEQGVRLKYVVIQKGENEFLGATVRCERRSILIARIVNGGLAQKTGLLHEGDEILSANGVDLIGKDLNTVSNILCSLRGKIVLLVAPSADPYSKAPSGGLIHLRALFTYEPEGDQYLACRELGLPFTKGDVLHVTGRRDPNWWQAYRSDEETGITGALGTLAGLIPSPIYQRHRAILRLQYWLSSGAEDVELEEDPSDEEDSDGRVGQVSKAGAAHKEKRFLGIKIFFARRKGSSVSGSQADLSADGKNDIEGEDSSESLQYLVNSALVNSIYAGRMPGQAKISAQPTEEAIHEWSAAGPVWGQHGYDMHKRRGRRGRTRGRKSHPKASPCLEGLRVPDPASMNNDDPVAWLDKEIARGFMKHYSLWTYEPVAQYVPQPLRRRPLVFVGPAHVGRHQLMQRLIRSDPDRFCPAAIHTTNTNIKSDSLVPYIIVSEDEFEVARKHGDFLEWGVFSRARYGTSRSTVRRVVEDGKVCCITLRPDSLQAIRSSGLMPYVIFISPPERVDELRRLQKRMGLTVDCSDMELKSCIEISRQMEVRYGHWFDKVIIPDALDTTLEELLVVATKLEREISWVPRYWLSN
ncbi:unnamed protein product [Calicophoron daubneyi]|uniref:MAGUK p55 subfamily member 5 n=1 Tax=Calicophoron daubneyi TaxID=300641 RepID=A0AAV2T973_CALDB